MSIDKELNVCLVSQEYPAETDFGGIATYMCYLSKALASDNNNVFVVCRSYKEDSVFSEGRIAIYRICENDEYAYRQRVADTVASIANTYKLDIIEAPEWGADLIDYYRRYKSKLNIPVVIKLHTPYFVWKVYNKIAEGAYIPEIEEWEREVIIGADGVFSCSDALKEIVAKEYNIDAKKIETIANLIEMDDAKTVNDCNTNDIYYFGSIEQRKGVLLLAEAFNKVKKQIPTAKIFFVGRDTTRNERNISTRAYIQKIIGDSEKCNFIEHIPNETIASYMQRASVLVFPSLFENFPYVVLEAMKCQKPIIGSKNGGMKEMIEEGVSGSLYTPPDVDELVRKICELLDNKELATSFGINAGKKVKEFAVEKIMKKQKAYYMEVIGVNAR